MSFPGSIGTDLKLVLSLTLWILLNSWTFFDSVCEWVNSWKFKVILMIKALRWQRKKEGSPSPALTFLAGADFLPGRPAAEWIPGDGQRLRAVVCLQPCAATDLWTWHAWEYRIAMATTNMGLNSISCSDSVSQTDNVLGLANCPQRLMWKLWWINFSLLRLPWYKFSFLLLKSSYLWYLLNKHLKTL